MGIACPDYYLCITGHSNCNTGVYQQYLLALPASQRAEWQYHQQQQVTATTTTRTTKINININRRMVTKEDGCGRQGIENECTKYEDQQREGRAVVWQKERIEYRMLAKQGGASMPANHPGKPGCLPAGLLIPFVLLLTI